MNIDCCHHCEKRHEKCHSHCEEYLTQKILKIMVEAQVVKNQKVRTGLQNEKERLIGKIMHDKHLRRRK